MIRQAFGYIRIYRSMTPSEIDALRGDLAWFADQRGFRLTETFSEVPPYECSAFDDLIAHIEASGIRNVVIPSLNDLCRIQGLGLAMRTVLEAELQTRVWVMNKSSTKSTPEEKLDHSSR